MPANPNALFTSDGPIAFGVWPDQVEKLKGAIGALQGGAGDSVEIIEAPYAPLPEIVLDFTDYTVAKAFIAGIAAGSNNTAA